MKLWEAVKFVEETGKACIATQGINKKYYIVKGIDTVHFGIEMSKDDKTTCSSTSCVFTNLNWRVE